MIRLDEARPSAWHSDETCTLIDSTGQYHIEHSHHELDQPNHTDVFEGSLSPADLQQLYQILNGKDFMALKSPVEARRIVV